MKNRFLGEKRIHSIIVNTSSEMFFEAYVLLLVFEMVSILAAIPNIPTQTQKFLPPEEVQKDSYKSLEAFKMCLKGGIICVPQNYSKFELPDPMNPTKVCFFRIYSPKLISLIKRNGNVILQIEPNLRAFLFFKRWMSE